MIDDAVEGRLLDVDELAAICALDPLSPEAFHLRWACRELNRRASGGAGAVFAQIGLDANPCSGECGYCSFAASNSSWTDVLELTDDQAVSYAVELDRAGIHLISLMTTCSYGLERFCEVASKVRREVSGDLPLIANIGDFGSEGAEMLVSAGIDGIYHAPRLGEGEITRIPIDSRFSTLDASRDAGLVVCSGVEPLRPGLDPCDVAERIVELAAYDPVLLTVSLLVAVTGTPWESMLLSTEPYRALIEGAARLALGERSPYSSMNVVWVDAGTRPRGVRMADGSALADEVRAKRAVLAKAGWEVLDSRDLRLLSHRRDPARPSVGSMPTPSVSKSDVSPDSATRDQDALPVPVSRKPGIFLDNAATSFPKAPGVSSAVSKCLVEVGCSLNRDGHTETCASSKISKETRRMLADLFGCPDVDRVVFTPTVTFSLNLVIKGLLKPGDHMLISSLEHNAVTRPVHQMAALGVEFDCIPCDSMGRMDVSAIDSLIRPTTRLVLCTHASNAFGNIHPLSEISRIAHRHGVPFAVDSAQTAGSLPIDMDSMGIDILCFTGHKGLMGPTGIGGVIMSQNMADMIEPLVSGGTGLLSRPPEMPRALPLRFEAGTYNIVGIYGLHAALEYLGSVGVEAIREHEMRLYTMLQDAVMEIPQARVVGETDPASTVAVLSVDFQGYDNNEIAYFMDSRFGITTRRGIHCAPYAHRALGTYPEGTVRISPGYFSTEDDVAAAIEAMRLAVSEVGAR